MSRIYPAALLFLFLLNTTLAQKTIQIKGLDRIDSWSKKCNRYFDLNKKLPADLRLAVQVDGRDIKVVFGNDSVFWSIFNKKYDGIAIEVVPREIYSCEDSGSSVYNSMIRGELLRPLCKREMREKLSYGKFDEVVIDYGQIPIEYDFMNIECNLIVFQRKWVCQYINTINQKFGNWELLDMGLFRDTLNQEQRNRIRSTFFKNMEFEIPFRKNEATFDITDIQPFLDTLAFTEFDIEKISIKAYSSIEGDIDSNRELQEKRAESIRSVLQQYQEKAIELEVFTYENWRAFAESIQDSPYEYLIDYSKNQVRRELKEGLAEKLEFLLEDHRKGVVDITLSKKVSEFEKYPELFVEYFNQSIAEKDVEKALFIQQKVLDLINKDQLPSEFLSKLEVPRESVYGPLLNNVVLFEFNLYDLNLRDQIREFQNLSDLLENNVMVDYNLTVLKLEAWSKGDPNENAREIDLAIGKLAHNGLEKKLVKRLRLNFDIIQTQYHFYKQDFNKKNRSISRVYRAYSGLDLADEELLKLSKYLAFYSKFRWAKEVLESRAYETGAHKDLIYYYLKLVLLGRSNSRKGFDEIFQIAIDSDEDRFCRLFLPKPKGGYSFQILEDKYLSKLYCERCN